MKIEMWQKKSVSIDSSQNMVESSDTKCDEKKGDDTIVKRQFRSELFKVDEEMDYLFSKSPLGNGLYNSQYKCFMILVVQIFAHMSVMFQEKKFPFRKV